MKEQIYILRGGEIYSAPTLDVLTVQVEQGFAQTDSFNLIDPWKEDGESLDFNN